MPESDFVSNIIFCQDPDIEIDKIIQEYPKDKIFTLVDERTKELCLPKVKSLQTSHIIESKSGEHNKTIDSVVAIWTYLNRHKADRKSLFINLGGGLLGDLGGFAASTFKRGMDFINIPTTLLAQVDASVGGKTGINLHQFKNEIGVIKAPRSVLISPLFYESLDDQNMLSGFAEMIKHALLDSETHFKAIQNLDFRKASIDQIQEMISHSVRVKKEIVQQDPYERNIRKALNLGHTIGHAFETFAQRKAIPLLHGEAVALGLIPELYLSAVKSGFPETKFTEITEFILKKYAKLQIQNADINELIEIMYHDKKNENDEILFTLLADFGYPLINTKCSEKEISSALKQYNLT